ncbi:hypothetical protein [Patulibacter americanus]|uniref:hypothetical protein n=1 Tax=Patulibacter americanus TaxID=588672 RepID=UPI0003B4A6D5|nr:hypothetical protein [Patulibacter americanus]
MDLTRYVDQLRTELAAAAGAGGDDARALAERLTAPLESSVRLMLLQALSAAADEVTQEIAPAAVDLRLRGGEPEFVVTGAPQDAGTAYDAPPAPAPPREPDDGATARVNLRLPEGLKADVERAAARDGLSVNAWLVRAASAALQEPGQPARQRGGRVGQSFTGWVR